MRLTDLSIAKLPFSDSRKSYWDHDLPSFGVRVGHRTKTFVIKQANRYHVLGRYPIVSLKQARDEARRRLALKYFPAPSPEARSTAESYLEAIKSEKRPSTLKAYEIYLQRLPGGPVGNLTPRQLYTSLPSSKSAANLCFATWRAFFSWCVERGYLERNPLLKRKPPHKTKPRDRLLTDHEIRVVWHESYNHNSFGEIVRSLILSGARLNQIARLDPAWIQGDTIVFPASIMKSNQQMTLPLTEALRRNLPTSSRPSSNFGDAMRKFRARLTTPHFTLHDFRRYFSSTMAKLGVPIDITEAMLSHTSGSRSQIQRTYDVYSRLEPMRKALASYEQHLSNFCDDLNISERQ